MRPCLVFASLTACASAHAFGPGDFKVIAYNVLYDAEDIDASLDVLDASNADLVCLTELTPRFSRAFEQRLGSRYPHRALAPRAGTWGVGIASRTPLSRAQRFAEKPHQIPAMEARAELGGTKVLVACLHLFPPVGKHKASDGFFETMRKNAELRRQQADYLVSRYQGEAGPLLLVGDMNEEPGDLALETFAAAGFARACETEDEDCGATFPGATSWLPAVFEIDHILGRRVAFSRAAVIAGGGSDHYAVTAVFAPSPVRP